VLWCFGFGDCDTLVAQQPTTLIVTIKNSNQTMYVNEYVYLVLDRVCHPACGSSRAAVQREQNRTNARTTTNTKQHAQHS
jgi:hypothetical protein